MDWLTLLVVLLLLVFAVGGWRTGLVRRLLELAGLGVAVVAAAAWSPLLARELVARTDLSPRVAALAAWVLLLLAVIVATRLLAWAVARLIHWSPLGWLDRGGGTVLGLAAGMLLGSVVLMVLCALPGGDDLRDLIEERPLPRIVYRAAPALAGLVLGEDGEGTRLWQRVRDRFEDLRQRLPEGRLPALPDASRDGR